MCIGQCTINELIVTVVTFRVIQASRIIHVLPSGQPMTIKRTMTISKAIVTGQTTITTISYMSAEERYAAGITWQIITRQVIIQPSANYCLHVLRSLHCDNRIRAQVRIVPAKHLAHSKNPLSTRRIAYHIAGEPHRASESLVTDDAGGLQ